jgi:hypothetical protein
MTSYFISRNGAIHGPFSQAQIEAGVRNGKLSEFDKIAPSREGPWTALKLNSSPDHDSAESVQSPAVAEESLATLSSKFEKFRGEVLNIVGELRESLTSLESQFAAFGTPHAIGNAVETAATEQPQDDSPSVSNWAVEIDRNPMDDSVVFLVTSPADRGVNQYGDPPTIVLRQVGDEGDKPKGFFSSSSVKIELFITWGAYFSDDDLTVTVRIGSGKPVRQQWGSLTDNTGTYFLGDARSLIREIAKAGVFTVEARPYQENPITAVFDCSRLARSVVGKAPQLASWFA